MDDKVPMNFLVPRELKRKFKAKCAEDETEMTRRFIEFMEYEIEQGEIQKDDDKFETKEEYEDDY